MNLISKIKEHWFSVIVGLVALIGVYLSFAQAKVSNYEYIRGQYGTHCYPKQDYPATIKHVLKFETLEDCLNSFKK